MMLPTHALGAMALALPVAVAAPETAGVAFGAALAGGVFPDLDMYLDHRRTLHYPVYFTLLAVAAGVVALAVPTPVTVAVAFGLLGAAVHSVADAYGGGLELRPWEGNADRAVYDHARGRWIAPRGGVRYDGAPEDLALTLAFAVPLLAVVEGPLRRIVVAAVVVGVAYTAVRRSLPAIAVRIVSALPEPLRAYFPLRYRESRR